MEVNTAEDLKKEMNRSAGAEKRKTHSTEVVKDFLWGCWGGLAQCHCFVMKHLHVSTSHKHKICNGSLLQSQAGPL